MRKLLAATAALATLTGTPLFAADMALKAPPLPASIDSWTGWYVGGNGGYREFAEWSEHQAMPDA